MATFPNIGSQFNRMKKQVGAFVSTPGKGVPKADPYAASHGNEFFDFSRKTTNEWMHGTPAQKTEQANKTAQHAQQKDASVGYNEGKKNRMKATGATEAAASKANQSPPKPGYDFSPNSEARYRRVHGSPRGPGDF
jgi:hypothetical protein